MRFPPVMGRFGVTSTSPYAHCRPLSMVGQESFYRVLQTLFKGAFSGFVSHLLELPIYHLCQCSMFCDEVKNSLLTETMLHFIPGLWVVKSRSSITSTPNSSRMQCFPLGRCHTSGNSCKGAYIMKKTA